MPDPTGSVPHNTAVTRNLVERLDQISQTYDQLKNGREFLAAERWTDVTDATQVADVFIGNESNADVDLLVTFEIGAGGLSHVTTNIDASVDTAGTTIPIQNKRVANGDSTTIIEYDGTYTGSNPIDWIIPASTRAQQPSGAVGSSSKEVRLLEPGEGVEYTVSNESGNAVDFDIKVGIIEIPV